MATANREKITNLSSELDQTIVIDSSASDESSGALVSAQPPCRPIENLRDSSLAQHSPEHRMVNRCDLSRNVPCNKKASMAVSNKTGEKITNLVSQLESNTAIDSPIAKAFGEIPGSLEIDPYVGYKVSVRCDSLSSQYLALGSPESLSFNGKQFALGLQHEGRSLEDAPVYPDVESSPSTTARATNCNNKDNSTSSSPSNKRSRRDIIIINDSDESPKKQKSSSSPRKPNSLDPSFSSQSYLIKLLCHRFRHHRSSTDLTATIKNKIIGGDAKKKQQDFTDMPWYANSDGLASCICHLEPKDLGTLFIYIIKHSHLITVIINIFIYLANTSTSAIDLEATKGTHFLHDRFSYKSLNELLHFKDETKFQDQVVMCIDQQGTYNKSPSRPILDPFLVDRMVFFKRNSIGGQIYRLKRLQASLHFSTSVEVAEEISFRVHHIVGGHKSIPKTLSIDHSRNCNFSSNDIFIHNKDTPDVHPLSPANEDDSSHESDGSISEDSDLFNHSDGEDGNYTSINQAIPKKKKKIEIPDSNKPLEGTRKHLHSALKMGLLNHIEFSEKKRGATKSSPVLSFGYTQTNANLYRECRKTDTFSAGPGFTKITCDLPQEIKNELAIAMDIALRCVPDKYMEYDVSQTGSERNDHRKDLNIALGVRYDHQGKPDRVEIMCEAFTIIIPLSLSAHRDVLNDSSKCMDSVIQINHSFSINDDTIPMPDDLRKWMKENGVDDMFPVSIIMYSRKVVGTICKKIYATKCLETEPPKMIGLDKHINNLCKKLNLSVSESKANVRRCFMILYRCINTAYFDTSSQRSIINTIERNGIINPGSLQAAIQSFEMKQDWLYLLMKKNEYEHLLAKNLPPKLISSLKIAKEKIMNENFEDPNRPGYANENGQRVGMFLNRGASLGELRMKSLHRRRDNDRSVKARRKRSTVTFALIQNYTLKTLYYDFATQFKPSKALHVHMMEDSYKVGEWEGEGSVNPRDDHLDFARGKTFMFDRIRLCTDYAKNKPLLQDDELAEDDPDLPCDNPYRSNKKYFMWREFAFGAASVETERVIPSPVETFNGPYYTLPSGWDKMVRIILHINYSFQ